MAIDALAAPERNRYFYGMLMDVERFDKDQRYFNRKRQLLNRLAVGPGVLCGLGLTFDGTALALAPGVAIDGAGVHGVRVTPQVYTSTADLDTFVHALKELAA